jgi:hypothetical protein
MIYRKLDANGDFTFGQNSQDFYSGVYAVAQAVKTRMQLLKGTFWRDLSDGLPLFQSILGASGSPANLAQIDTILQNRVTGTPNVVGITAFNLSFNQSNRQLSYQASVQTAYSATPITIQDIAG